MLLKINSSDGPFVVDIEWIDENGTVHSEELKIVFTGCKSMHVLEIWINDGLLVDFRSDEMRGYKRKKA